MVTQVKDVARDGYQAVQLAYGAKGEKHTTKPLKGHFEAAGSTPKRKLVEARDFKETVAKGDRLEVQQLFAAGDFVDVVGLSKGKGFCGVMKRHGFRGVGDKTHGQHNRERAPGSIGALGPSRVFKGTRMAGRMGRKRVTVKGLEVIKILPEEGLLLLKGSVPGAKGGFVTLQK